MTHESTPPQRALSSKQRASKRLFGDIEHLDQPYMAEQMDDKFNDDDGVRARLITPNELIAEIEAADRQSPAEKVDEFQKLRDELAQAKEDAESLQFTFDLQWEADMRAVKRWREAHPGNDLVLPDRCNMVVWLMEEYAKLRSQPANADGLAQAMEIVGSMRQSEAGLFDEKHSGQRGCDRADALFDAYVAIKKAHDSAPAAAKKVCPHCLGQCNPLPEGSGYCEKCLGEGWEVEAGSPLARLIEERDQLRVSVEGMASALTKISRQDLSSEMEEDRAEHADFQVGYDAIIDIARASLPSTEANRG